MASSLQPALLAPNPADAGCVRRPNPLPVFPDTNSEFNLPNDNRRWLLCYTQ
jgi:hypothetical protein